MLGEQEKNAETKWYVVRVYTGREKKAVSAIEALKNKSNWGKFLLRVLMPTVERLEIVKTATGTKKVSRARNIFPGYLFVEVEQLTDEMIRDISAIPEVVGFLRTGTSMPKPLTPQEIQQMLGVAHAAESQPAKMGETFSRGERVRITYGPFENFEGEVEEVFEERKKLRIAVTLFGRSTPVEVSFDQVEKI